MHWAALDDLITAATGDTEDVRAAREQYSELGGRMHDEHELFGERSDAFVEWYLLERTDSDGQSRLHRLLREGRVPEADRAVAQALAKSYRSLFLVTELGGSQRARRLPTLDQMATRKPGSNDDGRHTPLFHRREPSLSNLLTGTHGQGPHHGLVLRDLLGGGLFEVDERRRLPGINVGDIFEARLAPDPDEPYRLLFTRTFLCHPREAHDALLAQVAAAQEQGEERESVLFRLQRLRLRCIAYRHVPAARIYAQTDAPP